MFTYFLPMSHENDLLTGHGMVFEAWLTEKTENGKKTPGYRKEREGHDTER